MKSVKYSIALSASVFLACTAHAGEVTHFSDRDAFNSILSTPAVVENFTNTHHFPISTGVLNSETDLVVLSGLPIRPGDIKPGVTYSTAIGSGNFFNIDWGPTSDGGFLDGLTQPHGNPLTVTFDRPVNAFGFDTNRFMGRMFDMTIRFTHGPEKTMTFDTHPTVDRFFFYGFISEERDIASLVIEGNNTGPSDFSFALDNFTFSPPIPEPPTAALVLAGLGLIGTVAGRRAVHPLGR